MRLLPSNTLKSFCFISNIHLVFVSLACQVVQQALCCFCAERPPRGAWVKQEGNYCFIKTHWCKYQGLIKAEDLCRPVIEENVTNFMFLTQLWPRLLEPAESPQELRGKTWNTKRIFSQYFCSKKPKHCKFLLRLHESLLYNIKVYLHCYTRMCSLHSKKYILSLTPRKYLLPSGYERKLAPPWNPTL